MTLRRSLFVVGLLILSVLTMGPEGGARWASERFSWRNDVALPALVALVVSVGVSWFLGGSLARNDRQRRYD
jgi:hypothetical protein